MPRQSITNFSRGEFGPELYGRVDIPQYNAGAKELTNFIIQRYGGAAFRPGFRFVGEVDDAAGAYRYMPFQFSVEQAYVIVYGDSAMRLLADGGMVTEDDLKIISATRANPIVVEVPFHDMIVGDRVYLDGNSGMEELNGRFAKVADVIDDNHIALSVDSTAFGNLTDSTGIVRTEAPAPPPDPEPAPPPPPPPPPPPITTADGATAGAGTYNPGVGTQLDTDRL
jgi:hypothetical protein